MKRECLMEAGLDSVQLTDFTARSGIKVRKVSLCYQQLTATPGTFFLYKSTGFTSN